MEMRPGWLALSLAGNDRGKIYVIERDGGECVFLAGPGEKTIRKNKKHIQVQKRSRDDAKR